MPEQQQLTDIIRGCIAAERESRKALYVRYYGFATGICMRYCHSREDALETTNDGFLKVFNSIKGFSARHDDTEASLMGWMKRIMVCTAIDRYRKNRKYYLLTEIEAVPEDISDEAETAADKLSHKELLATVQQLSPGYRTVFNLYVIDGFTHEEIAKQLKISTGTSKSNLAKARLKIQQMLRKTNYSLYAQRQAI